MSESHKNEGSHAQSELYDFFLRVLRQHLHRERCAVLQCLSAIAQKIAKTREISESRKAMDVDEDHLGEEEPSKNSRKAES